MTPYDATNYAIVADIGGTFARFSRVNLKTLQLDKIEIYRCVEFMSIESVIRTYQAQHALTAIKKLALAIACPVIDDFITMTNCHWQFSISALQKKLDLDELKVMNDFTALATSLPVLNTNELTQIGAGFLDASKIRVVLGAGTGLGVAFLVPGLHGYQAFSGEGGHADWGPTTEQERFIYRFLNNSYSHVSLERLLSGPGLENIYNALMVYKKQELPLLDAAAIITKAVDQECLIAQAAVEQFLSILAAYAGSLALTFAAFGGIYIAGGIVPRLLPLIDHDVFRARFEDKGRFKEFNALIPIYIINAEQPGMIGAAVCLQQGEYDVVS